MENSSISTWHKLAGAGLAGPGWLVALPGQGFEHGPLQNLQNQIGEARETFSDRQLQFYALTVAYESIRLVWYAEQDNPLMTAEKMDELDKSVDELRRQAARYLAELE